MKVVRLDKQIFNNIIHENVVVEIIPSYALPVEKWYGKEFASQCVEAPDEVEQHWTMDENGNFNPPVLPE